MSTRQYLMHYHATASLRIVAPLFSEERHRALLAAATILDNSMSLENLAAANTLMHAAAHETTDPAVKAAAHATCYALASVYGRISDQL